MTGFLRRLWRRWQSDALLRRQARRDARERALGWDEPVPYWPADEPQTHTGIDRLEAIRVASPSFIDHALRGITAKTEEAERRWADGS